MYFATFNHLATAIRRCAPRLQSWEVADSEDDPPQAFDVVITYGEGAAFKFTTGTMTLGLDDPMRFKTADLRSLQTLVAADSKVQPKQVSVAAEPESSTYLESADAAGDAGKRAVSEVPETPVLEPLANK